MPTVLTQTRLRNVQAMDYYTSWADTTGVEGRWHTRSAAFALSEGDVVSRGHLRKIVTGSSARQRVDRHPGFDLTFSCPKSVSLVAFGHPDQALREGVIDDHEQSVKAALDWFEDHALVTRQTLDGVVSEVPVASIFALFRHNTSRAGDPQLHIHVLLPNLGVRPDGRLVAIDRHVMSQWKQAVDTVYRLELRARLGERGLSFNPANRHGLADLDGMPRDLILQYSKRRKEIEEVLREKEAEGEVVTSGDRRRIGAKTREKKLEGREAAESEDVGPRLRQELEDSGRGLSFWSEMQKQKRTPPVVDRSVATALVTLLLSQGGALAGRATWSRPDLLRALATVLPCGLYSSSIDDLANLVERDERIVPLVYVNVDDERAEHGQKGLHLVRARKRDFSVPSTLGLRFASRDLLEGEGRVIKAAQRVREVPPRESEAVKATLADALKVLGFLPSLEQQRLVRHFVTNQHFISCAVGVPGAGKTSAVRLCREAWDKLGVEVIGLSFKAKSAQELKVSAGIKTARTIDRFLKRYDPKDKSTWPQRGGVIVVDEASEISTSRFVRLVDIAQRSDCRIVLLGDDHQRESIEAGGLFATLMRSLGGVVLSQNQRQHEQYEREAVALVRRGYGAAAISKWFEADERARVMGGKKRHIKASTDVASSMLETVDDWLEDFSTGKDSQILCLTNADAEMFNWMARAALIEKGLLGDTACLKVAGRGEVGDRVFLRGERIVLTRNDYSLKVRDPAGKIAGEVRNGTVCTVVRSGRPWNTLIVKSDEGEIVLPQSYLRNHVEGGYASTVAKMQSTTLHGTSHIYQPQALGAEDFLVASSRATDGTYFHFLNQPGGDLGENSPVAEHASEDPVAHLAEMIEKMLWRQDREPISTGALSELERQREAQDLARDLGIAGVGAYLSVWQRYSTGELSWEEDDVDIATARVKRAKFGLAQTEANSEADKDDLRVATDKVLQAIGNLRAVSDYQEALHHGGHPDRRYARERVVVATMAVMFAEQFAEQFAEPAKVGEADEDLVGISVEPIRRAAGAEGLIDVQDVDARELPRAGEPAVDFEAIGASALGRSEKDLALERACALLYSLGVSPTLEAILEGLKAKGRQSDVAKAVEKVGSCLGTPRWTEDFIAHYSSYCRAQEAEVLLREGPPPVVMSAVATEIKPAEEEDDDVPAATPIREDVPPSATRAVEQPASESQQPAVPERTAKTTQVEEGQEDRLALVCRLLRDTGARATREGIIGAMNSSARSEDGRDRLAREISLMAERRGSPVPGELVLSTYRAYLEEHPLAELTKPATTVHAAEPAAPRAPLQIWEMAELARKISRTRQDGKAVTLDRAINLVIRRETEAFPDHVAMLKGSLTDGLAGRIRKMLDTESASSSDRSAPRPATLLPSPPEQHNQGQSF